MLEYVDWQITASIINVNSDLKPTILLSYWLSFNSELTLLHG